ncbi:MAG: HEAT repeat domain-containing protein [Planctomycetota bacterium]
MFHRVTRSDMTLILLLTLLCCASCQMPGLRVSETGPWPGLASEEPVVRTRTILAIQGSSDRNFAPLLFPLLNDPDRWVRYNARSTILWLAGDRRNTAPKYDYLSPPRERRYAVSDHQEWWNRLSSPEPPTP